MERRRADLAPVVAWTLQRLRGLGHAVERLETCHRQLDPVRALRAAQALTAASVAPDFRRLLHQAVAHALPELPLQRVWVQTYAHFRILVPGDHEGPVPAHTDFGFGHGLAERNLWLALTDAAGPGALHVAPLSPSLAWHARAGRARQVERDGPPLEPVPVRAGEVLLFTPLHVHAAQAPTGGVARVSIDLRICPRPVTPRDFSFSPLLTREAP